MKRREFVKHASKLSFAPILINQIPLLSFATADMLSLVDCAEVDDRVLVIIFMKGGNDGLNTIIPINQYDTYVNLRPNISIPDSGTGAYINLDTNLAIENQVGLHPAMTSFKSMYDAGSASVIQGVGYPDSNGSHFKSTDLWLTGGDGTQANFNIESGWMGRYLDAAYPGLVGNPTETHPDPIGIQLGDRKPSLGYYSDLGKYTAANLSQQDPSGLYNLIQSIGTPNHLNIPLTDYGTEIAYIMSVENSMSVYAQRVTQVFNAGTNSAITYPNSDLSRQLKTVARLISGGSLTKIYLVHTSGFDTHSGQVQGGATNLGTHAGLLANIFDSVKAFHDDLGMLGHAQRVVTSTFSEFGRRMTQNGSLGTDHGNFAPMFLFGQAIEAGAIGTNVNLSTLTNSGNLPDTEMQHDYRQVFHTLIQDWLGGSNNIVTQTQFGAYPKLTGVVDAANIVGAECYSDTFVTQTICRVKIFLEGYFDTTLNQMKSSLDTNGLIPLAQPYNSLPFDYQGAEVVVEMPPNVIDWILVELRDPNDVNTIFGRRAAFLRNDGQLIGLNGGLGASFPDIQPGDYYIAVFHRSHIAVVSSTPVSLQSAQDIHDFTISETQALGTNQLKALGGVHVMVAGDFDGNGIANQTDYDAWKLNSSKIDMYETPDADGNGVINNKDYNLWKRNENHSGHSSIQL